MPRDWQTTTIGSLARVIGGGTPSTSVPSYWGGPIPWFTPAEIDAAGSGIVATSERTITPEGLRNSAAKILPAGTVLVTSRASIGNVAVAEVPVATNQGFASLVPLDPRSTWFLYYWIQQFRSELESRSAGSTFLEISAAKVRLIEMRAPGLAEQLAISSALRGADQLIVSLRLLIAKKRAVKQGVMQELLNGRTRLAGFTKRWPSRKLDELLSYEQPGRYLVSSTDYVDSGTPVLTAGKTFVLGYTTETTGICRALPVIIFDDFTTDSKFVDFPFKAKSSAMKILSARRDADLRFIYERMQRINFVPVDHKRRWIAEYSKIEVDAPSIDEQRAIADVAIDADGEIEALERRLEATRAIKQGMMQELLTGRTRLVPAEAGV